MCKFSPAGLVQGCSVTKDLQGKSEVGGRGREIQERKARKTQNGLKWSRFPRGVCVPQWPPKITKEHLAPAFVQRLDIACAPQCWLHTKKLFFQIMSLVHHHQLCNHFCFYLFHFITIKHLFLKYSGLSLYPRTQRLRYSNPRIFKSKTRPPPARGQG